MSTWDKVRSFAESRENDATTCLGISYGDLRSLVRIDDQLRASLEVQREETLKLQDDLLQAANREVRLRVELDAVKAQNALLASPLPAMRKQIEEFRIENALLRRNWEETEATAAKVGAELEEARRRLETAHQVIGRADADNEALRGRLGEAERLLRRWRRANPFPEREELDDETGAFLASGSSTGEADRFSPVASMSAASENPSPKTQGPVDSDALRLCARKSCRHPYSVHAPAGCFGCDGQCRCAVFIEVHVEPAAPPQPAPVLAEYPTALPVSVSHQPAPVEQHAFVVCNCEFCKGERCAKEPSGGGRACGQPRGAAVHGEGGK